MDKLLVGCQIYQYFPRKNFLLYNRGVANPHVNTTFPATGAVNGH